MAYFATEQRPLCPLYMVGRCPERSNACRLAHDPRFCKLHWEGHCPYGEKCRNSHNYPNANIGDRQAAVQAAIEKEREKREAFQRALQAKGVDPKAPDASRLLGGNSRQPALIVPPPGTAPPVPPRPTPAERSLALQRERDAAADLAATAAAARRSRASFDPERQAPDLRLVLGTNPRQLSVRLQLRDVGLFPNIFSKPGDETIYERIVDELSAVAIDRQTALLKPWHGDTHWVADDSGGWKSHCPTYQDVVDRVAAYFDMHVTSTRLNWYKDGSDYKPFHHDSAAINSEKAERQNFSVGVSFGATRELALEDVETKRIVSIPLEDGTVYGICRDANILWRHSILQVPGGAEALDEGRISIVIWGWVEQARTVMPPARLRNTAGSQITSPYSGAPGMDPDTGRKDGAAAPPAAAAAATSNTNKGRAGSE